MCKTIFVSIILVIGSCAVKPKKLEIPYVLPYQVTMRIIEELDEQKLPEYYCILRQAGETFTVTLSSAKSIREIESIDVFGRVKSTNRFVIAGAYKIPLLFNTDFLFSTRPGFAFADSADMEKQYSEVGIAHSYTICDYCLTITFDKNGQIISENYGALKKARK